jgi:bifunctional DNA-binding transcriptional regulator/antitoxin component of YhaV-PrlF toxin-antitoxin module
MKMIWRKTVTAFRSEGSTVIPIPGKFCKVLEISPGSEVLVERVGRRIKIEKVGKKPEEKPEKEKLPEEKPLKEKTIKELLQGQVG